MPNFTAALEVFDTPYHITVCFAACKKGKKVTTSTDWGTCVVTAVEYWAHCDLTVALVTSEFCDIRAKYWEDNGYWYTLGYLPHFTLGKGDLREQYSDLVDNVYTVGNEYCRVY